MIRSTKTSLKFSNKGKLNQLHCFIDEYRNVVIKFIDLFWDEKNLQTLIDRGSTSKIESWLSKRAIQCAAKQASAIVRGTRQKQKQRLFMIKKLIMEGKVSDTGKLQRIYDGAKISKPNVNNVEPELDSRFVKIDMESSTSFNGWITLSSLGNKLKLIIPFKKHKHFNKMLEKGVLKSGVRLSKNMITFMFDIEVDKKVNGTTLGIDVGLESCLSCSNGQVIQNDNHGHNFMSICKKIARREKESKGFKKAQAHRANYINWSINRLNLIDVKEVNREEIKHLRKNKRVSKIMSAWSYGKLFDVLDRKFEEQGVLVNKLSPAFTSQRCSRCGWVREGNRRLKIFKCDKCFFEHDADLNASINLSLKLEQRLSRDNKTGFYWSVIGQERIVPDAQKITS